jgi:hypothetical protein
MCEKLGGIRLPGLVQIQLNFNEPQLGRLTREVIIIGRSVCIVGVTLPRRSEGCHCRCQSGRYQDLLKKWKAADTQVI